MSTKSSSIMRGGLKKIGICLNSLLYCKRYRFNAIYSLLMCKSLFNEIMCVLPFENFVTVTITERTRSLFFTLVMSPYLKIHIPNGIPFTWAVGSLGVHILTQFSYEHRIVLQYLSIFKENNYSNKTKNTNFFRCMSQISYIASFREQKDKKKYLKIFCKIIAKFHIFQKIVTKK